MQTEQQTLESTNSNNSRSIRGVNQDNLDGFDDKRNALYNIVWLFIASNRVTKKFFNEEMAWLIMKICHQFQN